MAPSLLSLPPPLFATILQFAVSDFSLDLVPYVHPIRLHELHDVAQVSKTSLQLVRNLVSDCRAAKFELGSDNSTILEDIQVLYQSSEAKRVKVRDLRLKLESEDSSYFDPKPLNLDTTNVDWDRIFELVPNMRRLEISTGSLVSRHVPEIVEAAAKHCRGLEALILPSAGYTGGKYLYNRNPMEGAAIDKLMLTLYTAMKRWHERGNGLRQLTVPTRNEVERLRSSTEFLEAVIEFCPKIEYLDGWEKVVSYGDALCEEMWVLSLETWETFNSKCTNLRTFSWAVVPFADPFFRAFGDHVKPHLKSLSLSANKWWNYERYFRECKGVIVRPPIRTDDDARDNVEVTDNATRPGFGLLATEPSSVFRACPALTSLSIEINHLENGKSQYVNTNLFGDEFWEAVSEHCPLLESIDMNDCSGYANFNIQSIDTLTDTTLLTFSRMQHLSNIELAPARLTGKSVFEYVRQVVKLESSESERTTQIQLGGHRRNPLRTPRFYTQIVKLLKLLSEMSEDTLGAATCRQKQVIYIKNPYESKVDRIWGEVYMRDHLMPLLEAVQAKHPSLGLGVWIFGRRGNVFSRIDFISLKWQAESDFDRELFHEWEEEDAERDTYRDAAMYENISGDEGEEDEGVEGNTIQDLFLWQAIMARFMHLEED